MRVNRTLKKKKKKIEEFEEEKTKSPKKIIREKLENLINKLLDESLNDEITFEGLVTKTQVARIAVDYLKLSNIDDEEAENFFSDITLNKDLVTPVENLQAELQALDFDEE